MLSGFGSKIEDFENVKDFETKNYETNGFLCDAVVLDSHGVAWAAYYGRGPLDPVLIMARIDKHAIQAPPHWPELVLEPDQLPEFFRPKKVVVESVQVESQPTEQLFYIVSLELEPVFLTADYAKAERHAISLAHSLYGYSKWERPEGADSFFRKYAKMGEKADIRIDTMRADDESEKGRLILALRLASIIHDERLMEAIDKANGAKTP